jgi:hypothetical protein
MTRSRFVALAAALAGLLGACGGGTGGTAQRNPATVTSTPSNSATPSTANGTATHGTVGAAVAPWKLAEPTAREIVVTTGPDLEIVGGLDHTKFSTTAVVVVDPATGAAQAPAKLAEAVHDAAGSVLGGRVLVFGGGGPSENGTADVQAVPSTGMASVVGKLPQSRSDHAAATVGNKAYVFGGYDGSAFVPSVLSTTAHTADAPVAKFRVVLAERGTRARLLAEASG